MPEVHPAAPSIRPGAAAEGLAFADRRALLEANLTRQIEAIRASDAKIVLLVPTTTAMIGVLAALFRGAAVTGLPALTIALSTLPLLVAYFFMALTLIPRLRPGGRSLLFFGGVATRDAPAYGAEIAALTPEAYLADLADQCHVTAGIARTKYAHVRHAYLAFFAALPFWALAVFLLNGAA